MAHHSDLPCDGDGLCMKCTKKPDPNETITCKTCVTPWHASCLSLPPATLSDTLLWECPDCALIVNPSLTILPSSSTTSAFGSDLIAAVRAIEADRSLTDQEKAKRRQELMTKTSKPRGGGDDDDANHALMCSICCNLPERPVTTPCGHNFCLKCFQKLVGQGTRSCPICRAAIPQKMVSQPRINSTLVMAIRMVKNSGPNASEGPPKTYQYIHNQDRPDKAFTTERAKKAGKANACSGKIFVTIPADYFGPILPEHDPEKNTGVLVGRTWEDRMECRQWGAHFPHVAGIAGQADYGAQSVALSGGYEDDEDHGEWFLYTGSGGRDLSGNKRTNKIQSFDQMFNKVNEALRVSCLKGYPVRVVRSCKEKRSSYAPEEGVRYDGIYRVEKSWRKVGIQGCKVCRYLLVRCDNEPAPWTSDDHGDRPRPLPDVKELENATDITERKGAAAWDFDELKGCWLWKQPPPESRKPNFDANDGVTIRKVRRRNKTVSVKSKLLKEFGCPICRKVMASPLTTPCGHNFCKACLEGIFAGQSFVKQRNCQGRTLRAQKNIMKCPSCTLDISDFLRNPQVNRELMSVIESLQRQAEEENEEIGEEIDGCSDGNDSEQSEEADDFGSNVNLSEDHGDGGSNDVAGDKENYNINSGKLNDDKDEKVGNAKPSISAKSHQTNQPKKDTSKTSYDKAGLAKGLADASEVDGLPVSPVDEKVKRTPNKRKKLDNGSKKAGGKRAKKLMDNASA